MMLLEIQLIFHFKMKIIINLSSLAIRKEESTLQKKEEMMENFNLYLDKMKHIV